MRIVAGSRRGLNLNAPEGTTTRPTSERARESLFNILATPKHAKKWHDRPVADFFAGTGALGLEALSRGARHCSFLENDPAASKVLSANINKARFRDITTILNKDATKPPTAKVPCGLIFFDPPYRDLVAENSLVAAQRHGWLAKDGLAVLQLHPKAPFECPPGFDVIDDRRYGATRFLFLEPAQG
ncbi:16S rRNA (guanine(966)-N(2))-methyltransferase RsmD [Hwanghaeella sp. LZ110]|jgi:16S rRNA (guanine966-N2)-methyltransferase|uniref:16S rRNA (guanine(966)-N(2))-methyltransferase RsmD n=1 Tax=Hwanghaeella sp. LZ110 TaxID=3402810 RepID=UPI003B684BD4